MTHDDRLILLLRDLAALAELRRDSSPFAIVPRSMRGGSALGSMISKASNAPTDATDAQVRRLTQYLLTGRGQTATQVRGALLLRIAEEPLPGDPAAEYDPVHAQEVARRVEVAPPRIRCVLDALRHVPTPYDPREAVCQRLADVLVRLGEQPAAAVSRVQCWAETFERSAIQAENDDLGGEP